MQIRTSELLSSSHESSVIRRSTCHTHSCKTLNDATKISSRRRLRPRREARELNSLDTGGRCFSPTGPEARMHYRLSPSLSPSTSPFLGGSGRRGASFNTWAKLRLPQGLVYTWLLITQVISFPRNSSSLAPRSWNGGVPLINRRTLGHKAAPSGDAGYLPSSQVTQ